jgi:hypothetical protein
LLFGGDGGYLLLSAAQAPPGTLVNHNNQQGSTPMLKRIAVLAVMSALSMGFAVTALAGSSVVLRVVAVKTDNVAAYVQEIDRAKAIVKRLGLVVETRVWRASFAGSAAGTVIVSQEFASLAAFADAMSKVGADPEYSQLIKGLDKVRTVLSDSLYSELP